MKTLVRSLLLGGALVAATTVTASPASAACYNYDSMALHIPTVCIGYDYCDADICIDWPKIEVPISD